MMHTDTHLVLNQKLETICISSCSFTIVSFYPDRMGGRKRKRARESKRGGERERGRGREGGKREKSTHSPKVNREEIAGTDNIQCVPANNCHS